MIALHVSVMHILGTIHLFIYIQRSAISLHVGVKLICCIIGVLILLSKDFIINLYESCSCPSCVIHNNTTNNNETLKNRACFSKTIDLRGHMPMFTLKINVFPSISLETL